MPLPSRRAERVLLTSSSCGSALVRSPLSRQAQYRVASHGTKRNEVLGGTIRAIHQEYRGIYGTIWRSIAVLRDDLTLRSWVRVLYHLRSLTSGLVTKAQMGPRDRISSSAWTFRAPAVMRLNGSSRLVPSIVPRDD